MSEIIDIINDLRAYPTEREWFEFKHNWFDAVQIGEYISALSNAAASVVTIPFRWINSVGWNVEQLENCTVKSEKFGVNDEKFGVNDENCTVKSESCTVNDKKFTVNNNGCTVNVPKIALETYRLIQENKSITSQKISDKTGFSLRTVKNHIALLKERGLIIRVGSDKTGHWEIVSNGDADDR